MILKKYRITAMPSPIPRLPLRRKAEMQSRCRQSQAEGENRPDGEATVLSMESLLQSRQQKPGIEIRQLCSTGRAEKPTASSFSVTMRRRVTG